ncbi:hypothetical protein ACIA5D_06945 [Actinoplanes sp. NPDC051513]|uniref:hypothetical protein n=1 Tax=Actinoplanes sp. NPDC051513 TaxID=3363908 RepID=UPI00379460E6
MLHIMAVVQLRSDTEGRRDHRRRLAEGKTSMEAMLALKCRLSDVVNRQMTADAQSSAAGPDPETGTSEKSLPGPAEPHSKTPLPATS